MKRLLPSTLFSVLCLAVPLSAQGAEHDLKIAAKKGATVWLVQQSKQEQAIDMGGQQMDMGNQTTFTVQVTVKDVDDKGNLVVETKVARVHGSMTLPMMGDVEFDSATAAPKADGDEGGEEMGMPNLDGIGKAMTELAGKTFVAKVDAFGNVASVEGVQEVLDAARKKAGTMGAQMLGGALNDSTIERLVESAFGVLPKKPMAVGATWEHSEDAKSSRMKVANKMQLTLAKLDAESFEITSVGTVEKPADADKPAAGADESEEAAAAREMLSQMKIKNGKISGSQKISRQDGFTIESSSVISMDLEMPSPMGGEMSIVMKSTNTTKRTTAEAALPKKAAEPAKEAAKEPAKKV